MPRNTDGLLKKGQKRKPESIAKQKQAIADRRVTAEALADIRRTLFESKDSSGFTNSTQFIKNFVAKAKKNPNSNAGNILAAAYFGKDMLEKLDADLERQMARDKDFLRFRLHKLLFREQREVLLDRMERKKVIICGRRAGKTDGGAGLILDYAIDGDCPIFYINLTFGNAIDQLWETLIKYSEAIGLGIEKKDRTSGEITWVNKSRCYFRGNHTTTDMEKLRGYKARLVVIDECGAQRWLRSLVDEIITPLTFDYADSSIVLQGTPPRIAKTFFEAMWWSGAYKQYHWTMFENPHIPSPREALDEIMTKRGLSEDNPFIQREYLGVIGSYDVEAMVYKERKYHTAPPPYRITDIAVGIDWGFSDYNAIIGGCRKTLFGQFFEFVIPYVARN